MGTYTGGTKLYKPDVGEGGWGTLVDTNFDRLSEVSVNVKSYGAVGDGTTNDTAAIQAAVDAIGGNGGTLFFPPGVYKVASPGIILPGRANSTAPGDPDRVQTFHIWGYGATILATTAISMMKRANPTEYSPNAVQMTSLRFSIAGLRFLGNSTAGTIGLDMVATYGMNIKDCHFDFCDVGLRLTYCLMTAVEACFETQCITYGFHCRSGSGVFTDGTTDNSGSNHTIFSSCHSSAAPGALAQWRVEASSGVALYDCIAEGYAPVNAIEYTGDSGSDRLFTVRNLHSENAPTNAIIKLGGGFGGHVDIDGLWHAGTSVYVDSGTFVDGTIRVKNIPRINFNAPLVRFAQANRVGPSWWFEDVGSDSADSMNVAASWRSAVIPDSFYQVSRVSGANAMKMTVRSAYDAGDLQIDALLYPLQGVYMGTGKVYFGAFGASADTNLYRAAADVLQTDDGLVVYKALSGTVITLTDAATVAVNAALGNYYKLSAGASRTIAAPTNPAPAQEITIDILNNTAGAITTTWNAAFKLAGAFTDPATTKRRLITFIYDGSNWIEKTRAGNDI